jgi:hypothetical protein
MLASGLLLAGCDGESRTIGIDGASSNALTESSSEIESGKQEIDQPAPIVGVKWLGVDGQEAAALDGIAFEVTNILDVPISVAATLRLSGLMGYERTHAFQELELDAGESAIVEAAAEELPLQVKLGVGQVEAIFVVRDLTLPGDPGSIQATPMRYFTHGSDSKTISVFGQEKLLEDKQGFLTAPKNTANENAVLGLVKENGVLQEITWQSTAFQSKSSGKVIGCLTGESIEVEEVPTAAFETVEAGE